MEWLQRIFDKILSVFPMVHILTTYEAGVRFTFGKYPKKLGPGWYILWPLFQRIVWQEVQTQIVDLRNQSIRTSDSRDVVVSGAIQYNIYDMMKATCNVQNVDAALETLALGIILEYVNSRTLKECHDIKALKAEVLKGLRDCARGWGVKIEKVYITDLGVARNLRLLGNIPQK